jgi:hypothetical protein
LPAAGLVIPLAGAAFFATVFSAAVFATIASGQ